MKNSTDLYDYYSISGNLPDGFFIVDNNREITLWNKVGERIFEYRAEEMVG
jgi:PAS domain S-box-containing protein